MHEDAKVNNAIQYIQLLVMLRWCLLLLPILWLNSVVQYNFYRADLPDHFIHRSFLHTVKYGSLLRKYSLL